MLGLKSTPHPQFPKKEPTVTPCPTTLLSNILTPSPNIAINADVADPDFQSMLHTVGVVDPSGAMSRHTPFSQSQLNENSAIHVLSQRSSISAKQREEFENPSMRARRNWVDTGTIRKIIQLRDEMGWDAMRIEKELGLADGLVERLGNRVAAP